MSEATDLKLPADHMDRERLFAVINNMTDGVLALDANLTITMGNSVALNILDTNAVVGRPIGEIAHLTNKAGRPVDIPAELKKSKNGDMAAAISTSDWRLKHSDDTTTYLFVSVAPVHHGFGKGQKGGFVMILRDISHEKSLDEERDEFISVASHELRTPVAVAEGYISNALLSTEQQPAPDSFKTALGKAHEQILFLGNLLNDLATLSRAERGKLHAAHEEFDADKLMDSLIEDFKPQALSKSLSLEYQGAKNLGKVSSNRLYVREILQNFITNAIKYTEKGDITLAARPAGDGLEFAVSDTGIGVGHNEHSSLGQKFFRSSDYRVKQINGTGLGLYVATKLTDLIGGKLSFDSEINKGSTFRIWVPLRSDSSSASTGNKALGAKGQN